VGDALRERRPGGALRGRPLRPVVPLEGVAVGPTGAAMDAVIAEEPESARRVRAFRATDQFALAAWQAARSFARAEGESLAREVRRALARSGGALVAAATGSLADAPVRRAL